MSPRRLARAATALGVAVAAVLAGPAGAQAQVGVPVTYQGPAYDTTVKRPSENKPQSKLWYAAGAWWGLLVSPADDRVHIHELLADHTWRDTGVLVDDRLNSTGDAHWDAADGTLTVASRASGSSLRVARFQLTAARAWARLTGFPVTVNSGGGSESAAIDRDSTGRFWVTYTRGSRVWVAASDPSGRTWTSGFQPNVPDVTVKSDDISSVISFKGHIGVLWSDQQSHAFRMAVHRDGAPDNAWSAEDALAGTGLADDHINLKTVADDPQGRVYAAVKTSQDAMGPNAPLVGVLIRTPRADGTGDWRFVVAGTVADDHTRPIIQIDRTNNELYFFATAPVNGGDIYYKKTSLANPVFGPGRGQKFVDATPVVNNATGSKHPVTAETGMVILAVAEGKKRYYHAEMQLAGSSTPPADTTSPSVPTELSATASTGRVDLSWAASSDASGISGYLVRRDGQLLADVAATAYTDQAVTAGASYSYTVQARDGAGNLSAESAAVGVTVPADEPPPTGTGVVFRAAASAANNAESTLTVPAPAHQPGDLLVATVDYRGQSAVTAPAGWTLVREDANGTAMRKATYWRRAGPAEPATFTWSFGARPAAVGSVLAYAGVSSTDPVEDSGGLVTAKSTAVTAPSVSASAGAAVVALFGVARSTSISPPGGTMERTETTSPSTVTYPVTGSTADRAQAAAGATGDLVATSTVSGPNIGHSLVLRAGS